ncbi:MAG TPA: PKD domain-containing protein [Acidobacteriota bacterium]
MPWLFISCDQNSTGSGGSGPAISGMTPSVVNAGQQNVQGQINGTNLSGVVSVDLGPGIKILNMSGVSSTEIDVMFSVDRNASPGMRTITVSTVAGSATSSSLLEVKRNSQPVARFTMTPNEGTAGTVFNFDASNSSSPGGTIQIYDWDFGDFRTEVGKNVTHQYANAGNYTVKLTITDDRQQQASATREIQVKKGSPPIARFTVTPSSGGTSEEFRFDASESEDKDGQIVSYEWKFNGGTKFTGKVFTRKFPEEGNYTVELTVLDDDGLSGTRESDINVRGGLAPIARFRVTPSSGGVDTTFTFDAADSSDSDGRIVDYVWKFAGGSTYHGRSFSRKFPEPGTYFLTLTVTDDDGLTGFDEDDIEVVNGGGNNPVAKFSISPSSGDVDTTFTFDASASSDDGNITNYSWKFNGGSKYEGKIFSRKFPEKGTYNVELTVSDDDGLQDTAEKEIEVGDNDPPPQGVECRDPARRGPAWYGKVLSTDDATHSVIVKLDEDADCSDVFYKCGDIRKGGDPTPPEIWFGIICRMVDLGNSTFQIFLVEGKAWPDPGEDNIYLWWQDCSEDPCR